MNTVNYENYYDKTALVALDFIVISIKQVT